MSRLLVLVLPLLLAACGREGLGLGGPVAAERRGAVEMVVKDGYPGILHEIGAGGGPTLAQAFDAAGVLPADRPARVLQLQGDLGLYRANPGALVAAIALWGT